jgi:hypothetical protein
MFANMKNYKIIKILQFDKLQVYVLKFTSLQITKLQDYKLHVLVCKFQIYKTKNFSIYKINKIKLEMHFCIFTSLHMLDFHVFILACPTKLPNFQLQNIKIQSYKLQIASL